MTQKELSYVEDAIGHVCSIIKILEESISNLDDDDLIDFINDELDIHKDLKQNLINKLEEKIDE